eukprot:TRINITY_DN2056_c0_g1_i1.p1 TRINITY_DN2056_c0_g1~~TRINITY_DN2056_c0_g1_i1.p1  ORF type:complete len:158 (-),score=20.69 TRINITY_DN2056_c0_g1_i1:402-875(-)
MLVPFFPITAEDYSTNAIRFADGLNGALLLSEPGTRLLRLQSKHTISLDDPKMTVSNARDAAANTLTGGVVAAYQIFLNPEQYLDVLREGSVTASGFFQDGGVLGLFSLDSEGSPTAQLPTREIPAEEVTTTTNPKTQKRKQARKRAKERMAKDTGS